MLMRDDHDGSHGGDDDIDDIYRSPIDTEPIVHNSFPPAYNEALRSTQVS